MGVLLRGEQGEFVLNNPGWAMVLRLAWDYGWRPAGTRAPRRWEILSDPDDPETPSWNPADYVTCRGQRVTDEDADLLAEALAAMVDDLPHTDPVIGEDLLVIETPGFPGKTFLPIGRSINAFEALGGSNRDGFRALLRFCRRGGFEIW